jgi:cytochrome c biogenesis protein CcdA
MFVSAFLFKLEYDKFINSNNYSEYSSCIDTQSLATTVAISRAEKWDTKEVVIIGFVSAFAHVLGTIILGVLLGFVGIKLSNTFESYAHIIAPVLLIVLGLIYFSLNAPHHHNQIDGDVGLYKRNKTRWVLVFVGMMFLSPCLEVETLFLTAGGMV